MAIKRTSQDKLDLYKKFRKEIRNETARIIEETVTAVKAVQTVDAMKYSQGVGLAVLNALKEFIAVMARENIVGNTERVENCLIPALGIEVPADEEE